MVPLPKTLTLLLVFAALLGIALASSAAQVLVPGRGYVAADDASLLQVPSGTKIALLENNKGAHLHFPNGTVFFHDYSSLPKLDRAMLNSNKKKASVKFSNKKKDSKVGSPEDSGWVASAWAWGTDYNYFSADWPVPGTPSVQDGETIFFFNSFEDAAYDMIIQPVLQYGGSAAGGGAYWAVASWYVGSATYYTALTQVNSGDQIQGLIETNSGNYDIYCFVNGNQVQALGMANLQPQTSAQVTLEVYTVSQCGDYPTGNQITFSNLVLQDQGNTVNPNWQPSNNVQDCNVQASCANSQTCTISF